MTYEHRPPAIVSLRTSAGELPIGSDASAEVRRLAREVFADLSPARLASLLMLVDELVMNAQRLGGQLQEVHLCRFDPPAVAHVEVIATPPVVPVWDESAVADAQLGRLLLEDLALAWGLQREGNDWMTWVEV